MKKKRILVVGGAGSIGSELVRQLAPQNKIFILDISENCFGLSQELSRKGNWVKPRVGDIRNRETVRDLFEDFKPQIVFHAAAYKEVSPMELYPEEAVHTNVLGTLNLIHEAKRWECLEKFVFISTDKVVNATSVMGATKRLGEIMTRNQGKGFVAVRFGNVLGSRGSLLPIWGGQIEQGDPITVTDGRMERYFMSIPEACELVIKAAEIGKGGEIIVMDMGQKVNIKELATRLVQELRYGPGVKEIGIRPGETLTEELMSLEEKERAVQNDNFYIIQ